MIHTTARHFVTLCLQRTPQIEDHTIREYKNVYLALIYRTKYKNEIQ